MSHPLGFGCSNERSGKEDGENGSEIFGGGGETMYVDGLVFCRVRRRP